jgi:hypothetical protein
VQLKKDRGGQNRDWMEKEAIAALDCEKNKKERKNIKTYKKKEEENTICKASNKCSTHLHTESHAILGQLEFLSLLDRLSVDSLFLHVSSSKLFGFSAPIAETCKTLRSFWSH